MQDLEGLRGSGAGPPGGGGGISVPSFRGGRFGGGTENFTVRMEEWAARSDFLEEQVKFYQDLGVDYFNRPDNAPKSWDPGADDTQCLVDSVAEERRNTFNEWANSEQNTIGAEPYDPCDHGPCFQSAPSEWNRPGGKPKGSVKDFWNWLTHDWQ